MAERRVAHDQLPNARPNCAGESTPASGKTTTAAEPRPQTVEALEAALRRVLEDTKTPGLIATVVERDRAVWEGALGFSDSAHAKPITPRSRFRIGSITKMFTSLAALLLVERGAVSPDSDLADLVPEVGIENPWSSTDPVRLVHALEHSAGFDDIHLRDYALSAPDISLLEACPGRSSRRSWASS